MVEDHEIDADGAGDPNETIEKSLHLFNCNKKTCYLTPNTKIGLFN